MRVERRNGYRLIIGGPVPPQADAITIGKTILVRKRVAASQALLAHELVHVRQFSQLGAARFLARYLGSYLRLRASGYPHLGAYRRIPLEIEACWLARRHAIAELEPQPRTSRPARAHAGSARVRRPGRRPHVSPAGRRRVNRRRGTLLRPH